MYDSKIFVDKYIKIWFFEAHIPKLMSTYLFSILNIYFQKCIDISGWRRASILISIYTERLKPHSDDVVRLYDVSKNKKSVSCSIRIVNHYFSLSRLMFVFIMRNECSSARSSRNVMFSWNNFVFSSSVWCDNVIDRFNAFKWLKHFSIVTLLSL